MAKITRIKASESSSKSREEGSKKTSKKDVKTTTVKVADKKIAKKAKKEVKEKKPMSKPVAIITWPFRMIFKPFAKLGRYFKESWGELRQVHWPNRASTWKMVFAVLIYTALFVVLITLLDMLFTFVFNKILG